MSELEKLEAKEKFEQHEKTCEKCRDLKLKPRNGYGYTQQCSDAWTLWGNQFDENPDGMS